MDIIEIALTQYTDFKKFERLSLEIMSIEGFPNIKKIGGIDDDGIDAELVYYLDNETQKTIFQFSIQENVATKVYDTIEKLQNNKVEYNELIIVTIQQVNNIETIRKKTKEKFGRSINIEIYDRDTFIKTLSANNQIFVRHFPDIKSQLNSDLFNKKTIFSDQSQDTLTNSMLKCSLLFTFNPNANKQRKNLFDFTVLAIIVEQVNCSIIYISNTLESKYHRNYPDSQINATIDRLVKQNFVKRIEGNKIVATSTAIEKIEGNSAKVNSSTIAFINEIVAKVHIIHDKKIDKNTVLIIEQNIKDVFNAFFRLYGIEYSESFSKNSNGFNHFKLEHETDLIKIAKNKLPPQIGDILVYCIGETIKEPTTKQADILANWAKAFIGIQIMNLDPNLKEFHESNFKEKTFLLDTDFVLYCITDYCPLSPIYQRLLNELVKLKCEIIIPDEVLYEVIKHAEYSKRNYNYFRNTFDVVDEMVIDEKIANVFVKDFYNANIRHKIDIKFKVYLANFYEPTEPYSYLKDVIESKMPKHVKIKPISEILKSEIPIDIKERLTDEIFNETIKTFKSAYRSDEENREIAKNDATFYLAAYYLNANSPKDKTGILIGSHYLITTSTRALRCAKKINVFADVLTKPQTMVSLLDEIGFFAATNTEIVNLFENPFLINVVNENWDEIKILVDAGVELKGKNIPRLNRELKTVIHQFITKPVDIEQTIDENNEITYQDKEINADEFIDFAVHVKSKGYKFIPSVEVLVSKYQDLKSDKEKLEFMEKEWGKKLKRKQDYLDRITKK